MDKKPLIVKWLAIGIILLFVSVTITPAIAQNTEKSQSTSRGNWLYVGGSGPGNYSRIQDAIDNASDGDTVFVYDDSSPYHENIIINASITFLGENRDTTLLIGPKPLNVVTIKKAGVLLSGFSIQPYTEGFNSTVVYADSTQICMNRFLVQGILAQGCKNLSITNNDFINTTWKTLDLRNVNSSRIERNDIQGGEIGIQYIDCHNAIFAFNKINESEGISVFGGTSNIVAYNNSINKAWTAFHLNINNASITNNTICQCEQGIYLQSSNHLLLAGNVIKNCHIGVYPVGSNFNIIKNNDFFNNSINALGIDSFKNLWIHNYYGRPRLLPKLIFDPIIGVSYYSFLFVPWFNIDFHPALHPNRS